MSIKRFQFLCENLHFYDISSRNTRFHHDRTAAIRDLFESFVRNCEKVIHVQTTHNVVKYLHSSLTREAYIKGYDLSTDRFYTSIEIANWLLEKKCNLCQHHQRKPSRNQGPKEFGQQGITKHKGVLGQG